eukprot:GILJ01010082.1.p1 GENE.GILJ01010082.1~~GILJ01010082.1.p1  ORF type:complete len:251 (+),score=26.88 GILJ01010082.1:173-925(+)
MKPRRPIQLLVENGGLVFLLCLLVCTMALFTAAMLVDVWGVTVYQAETERAEPSFVSIGMLSVRSATRNETNTEWICDYQTTVCSGDVVFDDLCNDLWHIYTTQVVRFVFLCIAACVWTCGTLIVLMAIAALQEKRKSHVLYAAPCFVVCGLLLFGVLLCQFGMLYYSTAYIIPSTSFVLICVTSFLSCVSFFPVAKLGGFSLRLSIAALTRAAEKKKKKMSTRRVRRRSSRSRPLLPLFPRQHAAMNMV